MASVGVIQQLLSPRSGCAALVMAIGIGLFFVTDVDEIVS
jgi:hypothetical protein